MSKKVGLSAFESYISVDGINIKIKDVIFEKLKYVLSMLTKKKVSTIQDFTNHYNFAILDSDKQPMTEHPHPVDGDINFGMDLYHHDKKLLFKSLFHLQFVIINYKLYSSCVLSTYKSLLELVEGSDGLEQVSFITLYVNKYKPLKVFKSGYTLKFEGKTNYYMKYMFLHNGHFVYIELESQTFNQEYIINFGIYYKEYDDISFIDNFVVNGKNPFDNKKINLIWYQIYDNDDYNMYINLLMNFIKPTGNNEAFSQKGRINMQGFDQDISDKIMKTAISTRDKRMTNVSFRSLLQQYFVESSRKSPSRSASGSSSKKSTSSNS